MSAVLLVTGSRSLDPRFTPCPGTEASERWAREIIAADVDALPRGAHPKCHVMHGGASGPDLWASQAAMAAAVPDVEYLADGRRIYNGSDYGGRWEEAVPADHRGKPMPLRRNAAMVAVLAACADKWDVRVLALRCPWARTHGTEHTVTLARKAGLRVAEHTCPTALAPTVRP